MKSKNTNNDMSTELIAGFKTALKNPQKFYYILLRSGLTAAEAQDLMYDIRYPKLRMANPNSRKKIIKLLTKLINSITTDGMLYSRFLSISQNKKIFEMDTTSSNIPGISTPEVFMNADKLLKYIKLNKRKKPKFDIINSTN